MAVKGKMLGAPQPRFRIYTTPSTYFHLFKEFLTNSFHADPAALFDLEQKLRELLNVKHVVLTPTARTGIFLALSCLIKPGQKVILSPITIVDVINMVICAGGIPVFADVEPNTCNIDASEVEKLIDKNTGAVLITHLHGLACDVERMKRVCDSYGVPLVEDSAQAFSTNVHGKWVGTFGKAGVFSFGMYKNINAFLGGMIVTDDGDLHERIQKKISTFPMVSKNAYLSKTAHGLATDVSTSPLLFSSFTYWIFRYGYLNDVAALNGMVTVDRVPTRKDSIPDSYLVRMAPGQARLILPQLKNVEKNNQTRIKAALAYHDGLSSVGELVLPPRRSDGSHIYTYFPFRAPDRHALMRFAMTHRRDMVISHYHNCASLEIFKEFYRTCPNADATAKQLLYLATYPRYSASEVQKTIEVIRRYFRS